MERRSFVQLVALGGAVLVLPEALEGCAAPASPSEAPSLAAGALAPSAYSGSALHVRRFGDARGNLFDVYTRQNRVDFLDPSGSLRGRVTSGLNAPISLAVDPRGRVLVLDLGGHLQGFDLNGRALGAFASSVSLRTPHDLGVSDPSGLVAVADTLSHRIVLLDDRGRLVGALGSLGLGRGDLNGPQSVAFSPDGSRLYVADTGNARVQVFSPTGRLLDALGSWGAGPGQLRRPTSVRVDATGDVYVADAAGGYVTVFDAGHRLTGRFRPDANGRTGAPVWLASQRDGSVLVGAIPNA